MKPPTLHPLLWLVVLAGCGARDDAAPAAPPAGRPDVVLVVIDTLRADRTTALVPGGPTTPRIAARAARGIAYSQAIAPSSWTLPSMAALFSGREVASSRHRAFSDTPALAERFADAGYATLAVVANPLVTADNGFAAGFAHFDVAPALAPDQLKADLQQLRAWDAEAVVRRALTALHAIDGGTPVFLYVHLMDPHVPYDPAHSRDVEPLPGWSDVAEGDGAPAVFWTDALSAAQAAALRDWRRAYDGQVRFADGAVGRLLERLDAERPRPRVVAVTADHGEGLFSHARNPDRAPGSGPLGAAYDDHGEQLYEEAVRVPLWLFGHGVPAGRREDRPVAVRDLGPTLLELAGLAGAAARSGAPGRSGGQAGAVLPLGPDDPVPHVILGTGNRGWFARTAEAKLIVPFPHRLAHPEVAPRLHAVAGAAFAPETDDLSGARPRLRAELERTLADWLAEHGEPDEPATDAATLERLRALGYLR